MSRPLRIEFPGALHYVTSRGDRREPIYLDDEDRRGILDVLGEALDRFDAALLAYCLMGNHCHLVLRTHGANLSRVMRHLNGVYAQRFNWRRGWVGHLFQGRFKAILCDSDRYLMALCRYVELNPVNAGLVLTASAWPWSSYSAHVGAADAPAWLDVHALHGHLLGRDPVNQADHAEAARRYAEWVAQAAEQTAPDLVWATGLRQQVYLGDEAFVQRMQACAAPSAASSEQVPKAQRASTHRLDDWLARTPNREQALYAAWKESGLTMSALAGELGLSVSRVSRLIAKARAQSGAAGSRVH